MIATRQHRRRVVQGLLDLLLQRLGLFLVGRDLLEHRLERARMFAGLDEVHEQVVEVERMLGQRLVQRVAGLDVGLDRQHQLLHRGLVVADTDDLERLHHRDARSEHRGQLAGEDRDVFRGDLAFALEELAFLLDLGRGNALPSEIRAHLHFGLGQAPPLDAVALAVLAFPQERELLA